jgi:peptide/bleomycin uptake transporter
MRVPLYLSSWFVDKRHRNLAWFGLVFGIVDEFLIIAVLGQQWTLWSVRWNDLLQSSINEREKAVPKLWTELKTYALLTLIGMTLSPILSFFFSYYHMRWNQAAVRAYVGRWPDVNIPEGSSQRVHEDIPGVKGCFNWAKSTIVGNFTTLGVYIPMLRKATRKFPCPSWLPLPEFAKGEWALILAIAWPLASTIVSAFLARRLVDLSYAGQALSAKMRRILVQGEDGPFQNFGHAVPRHIAHALEPIFRGSMRIALDTWVQEMRLGIWLNLYDKLETALMIAFGVFRLVEEGSELTMGDLTKLTASFGSVFGVFSTLVGSFGTINE